jgi:hypothetical protein
MHHRYLYSTYASASVRIARGLADKMIMTADAAFFISLQDNHDRIISSEVSSKLVSTVNERQTRG